MFNNRLVIGNKISEQSVKLCEFGEFWGCPYLEGAAVHPLLDRNAARQTHILSDISKFVESSLLHVGDPVCLFVYFIKPVVAKHNPAHATSRSF